MTLKVDGKKIISYAENQVTISANTKLDGDSVLDLMMLLADGKKGKTGDTLRTDGKKIFWGSGPSGASGSDGQDGSDGYTGSRGPTGYTGSAGFTGSIGYTGSSGFTGSASNVQGPIGYTGSRGATGYAGSNANGLVYALIFG